MELQLGSLIAVRTGRTSGAAARIDFVHIKISWLFTVSGVMAELQGAWPPNDIGRDKALQNPALYAYRPNRYI